MRRLKNAELCGCVDASEQPRLIAASENARFKTNPNDPRFLENLFIAFDWNPNCGFDDALALLLAASSLGTPKI